MPGPPGLDRLGAVLGTVPKLPEQLAALVKATAVLPGMDSAIKRVASHTAVLPGLNDNMSKVAEATSPLQGMDARMATIEAAMPALVEVQQHLADLPATMGQLDDGIGKLTLLLEHLLVSMNHLDETVSGLQGSIEPLGRFADRVPGGRKQ